MSQYKKFTFKLGKPVSRKLFGWHEEVMRPVYKWPYWAKLRFGYKTGICHPNKCDISVKSDVYNKLEERFFRMKKIGFNHSGIVKINCKIKEFINCGSPVGMLFLLRDRAKGFDNYHHAIVKAVAEPSWRGQCFYIDGNLIFNNDKTKSEIIYSLCQAYERTYHHATI